MSDRDFVVLPRDALFEFFGAMALPPWKDEHGEVIGTHVDAAPLATEIREWVEFHDLSGAYLAGELV